MLQANNENQMDQKINENPEQKVSTPVETPRERAMRICSELYGSMKGEIAAHGGTEGYMRWVRGDGEDSEVDVWLRSKERKS